MPERFNGCEVGGTSVWASIAQGVPNAQWAVPYISYNFDRSVCAEIIFRLRTAVDSLSPELILDHDWRQEIFAEHRVDDAYSVGMRAVADGRVVPITKGSAVPHREDFAQRLVGQLAEIYNDDGVEQRCRVRNSLAPRTRPATQPHA